MKRQDVDTNNIEEISILLKKDLLNRNIDLYALLNFINGVDGSMILNIDGAWGTGKSVFLKELEYVGTTKEYIEYGKKEYKTIVDKFKKEYFVFYFNSWEHDLYNNPLESLICELLMKIASEEGVEDKIDGIKEEISETLKKVGSEFFSRGIKKITSGLIEFKEFVEEKKDFTPIITSMNTQKEAINLLIQKLSSITEKRILIIVDELDRCKPSYAVELLEIVKHFFTHDDVVFLFGTNKSELEHTIKSLYGQGFNGYKYLNRFFDFEFSLPDVNNEKYANEKHVKYVGGTVNSTIAKTGNLFNFTMRDIDRFYLLFNTLNLNTPYSSDDSTFINHIVMVYAIALKIDNGSKYNNFINGSGETSFLDYCLMQEDTIKKIYRVEDIKEKVREIYSIVVYIRNNNRIDFDMTYEHLAYNLSLLTMLNI